MLSPEVKFYPHFKIFYLNNLIKNFPNSLFNNIFHIIAVDTARRQPGAEWHLIILMLMDFYEFSFEELDIKPEDIELLMGFEPGNSPYPFPEWIGAGLQKAPSLCHIKGGFKLFDNIITDTKNNIIAIDGQVFNPGKTVLSQLKNATSAALYVGTAGDEISHFAKAEGENDDQFMSYIYDIIGTVTVEKTIEKILDIIEDKARERGLQMSTPFSPGYCNWSVAEQHKLFALLPENFCGIKLSESALMNPIKSGSGMAGLGVNCKRQFSQCHWCNNHDCIYGKISRNKNIKKT
jgi:hypothetical protein